MPIAPSGLNDATFGLAQGSVVNASRADFRILPGMNLRDGQPLPAVAAVPHRRIPRTGFLAFDRYAAKANDYGRTSYEVARTVTDSTLKGALYGLTCGLIIVALTQKMAILDLLRLPFMMLWDRHHMREVVRDIFPRHLFIAGSLIGGLGAVMGGFLGFHDQTRLLRKQFNNPQDKKAEFF